MPCLSASGASLSPLSRNTLWKYLVEILPENPQLAQQLERCDEQRHDQHGDQIGHELSLNYDKIRE